MPKTRLTSAAVERLRSPNTRQIEYYDDTHLPSISYLDLTAAIQISNAVNFRLGVNNLLDKDPPVIGSSNCVGCNGNVYNSVYDALGRYIFGTFTMQF